MSENHKNVVIDGVEYVPQSFLDHAYACIERLRWALTRVLESADTARQQAASATLELDSKRPPVTVPRVEECDQEETIAKLVVASKKAGERIGRV